MSGIVLSNRYIEHFGKFINDEFRVVGRLSENKEWVILEYRNQFYDKVFMALEESLEIV